VPPDTNDPATTTRLSPGAGFPLYAEWDAHGALWIHDRNSRYPLGSYPADLSRPPFDSARRAADALDRDDMRVLVDWLVERGEPSWMRVTRAFLSSALDVRYFQPMDVPAEAKSHRVVHALSDAMALIAPDAFSPDPASESAIATVIESALSARERHFADRSARSHRPPVSTRALASIPGALERVSERRSEAWFAAQHLRRDHGYCIGARVAGWLSGEATTIDQVRVRDLVLMRWSWWQTGYGVAGALPDGTLVVYRAL
jgi:hypothetical protein